ncbi:hypothetical protein OF83DRAFT_1088197, partial [Amylostereum chailletii]
WSTGDVTWLTYHEIKHLTALDAYCEAMGISHVCFLPARPEKGSDGVPITAATMRVDTARTPRAPGETRGPEGRGRQLKNQCRLCSKKRQTSPSAVKYPPRTITMRPAVSQMSTNDWLKLERYADAVVRWADSQGAELFPGVPPLYYSELLPLKGRAAPTPLQYPTLYNEYLGSRRKYTVLDGARSRTYQRGSAVDPLPTSLRAAVQPPVVNAASSSHGGGVGALSADIAMSKPALDTLLGYMTRAKRERPFFKSKKGAKSRQAPAPKKATVTQSPKDMIAAPKGRGKKKLTAAKSDSSMGAAAAGASRAASGGTAAGVGASAEDVEMDDELKDDPLAPDPPATTEELAKLQKGFDEEAALTGCLLCVEEQRMVEGGGKTEKGDSGVE